MLKTPFFVVLFFFLGGISSLQAGTVQCPRYSVILEGGSQFPVPGATYHALMELHKIGAGAGYNGTWKIIRFEQTNTYPHSVEVPMGPMTIGARAQFTKTMGMDCVANVAGNRVVNRCGGGNTTLNVVGGKVGSSQTRVWVGAISGTTMVVRFDKNNPFDPEMTGEIHEVQAGQVNLTVTEPQAAKKEVFFSDDPGILEMTLKAQVTPSEYADQIVWEIPEIEGSKMSSSPKEGPAIQVKYEGLPKLNNAFGKKTVKATVNIGACEASDSKDFSVFYPRDATNNPGKEKVPNWFYYWSQTLAKVGPAAFGGNSGRCSRSGDNEKLIGYYRNEIFDSVYYLCDLKQLGEDFPFQSVEWKGGLPDNRKVTGIDTFAAASRHENAHLRHFQDWWASHRTQDKFKDTNQNGILDSVEQQKDKDGDLVPDLLEAGFGLDSTKKSTYGVEEDDEEILTWKAEAEWAIGSADSEDWAKPGKQWK